MLCMLAFCSPASVSIWYSDARDTKGWRGDLGYTVLLYTQTRPHAPDPPCSLPLRRPDGPPLVAWPLLLARQWGPAPGPRPGPSSWQGSTGPRLLVRMRAGPRLGGGRYTGVCGPPGPAVAGPRLLARQRRPQPPQAPSLVRCVHLTPLYPSPTQNILPFAQLV
jgi:hypothetical protein